MPFARMKRCAVILIVCLLSSAFSLKAADRIDKLGCEVRYTDASALNLFNKLLPTENVWQRLDVEKYPQMTTRQKELSRSCTGMAVCFETDSPFVGVRVDFARATRPLCGSSPINARGFDLYVEKDGRWLWAGSDTSALVNNVPQRVLLLNGAGNDVKKCLLYLPLYSEINSLEVITAAGSVIRGAESGFKGRIAVFGSSYTNGSGCSRPAMAYPAQLARKTGYNFINMGMSGNSRLQDYYARAIAEAKDVDAFVFDAFSNPSAQQIRERLFPFIDIFVNSHPGKPLVFLKTVYREGRRFNAAAERKEGEKMAVADSMIHIAVKRYDNVYWIDCTSASDGSGEWTTDGVHPDDYGYTLFAESMRKRLVRILKKYVR